MSSGGGGAPAAAPRKPMGSRNSAATEVKNAAQRREKERAEKEAAAARRLRDMCMYLRIEASEKHLYWVAELALLAQLPPHWKEYKDEEGHAYFHNHVSNVTAWTHPRDDYFLQIVARERQKIADMAVLAQQQRKLRWNASGKHGDIILSQEDLTAENNSDGSYPSFRTGNKMMMGKHCILFTIDKLEEDGFIWMGVAKENFYYNTDANPDEDYNSHGYTSVGEILVCGRIKGQGREKVRQGDEVAIVVDFQERSIVWYRNSHPVAFFEGFDGSGLYFSVVMGHKGYQVSIGRVESIPHPIIKWDPKKFLDKSVLLQSGNVSARSLAATGYAVVRANAPFQRDSPYFELTIETLARDGFIMIGIGNAEVHTAVGQIPSAEYNHYAYSSTGEAYAGGKLVRKDLPRINMGDRVGFRMLFEVQRIVFYLNSRSVVELTGFPTYEDYYPCVSFGNAGYQVKIDPVPHIPLGVPRWTPDHLHPKRYSVEEEEMVAKGIKANTCISVMSTVEYDSGREYFEIRVKAIHPDGEMCIGLASSKIVDNFRMIPFQEFRHAGYKNDGQLVAFGEVVKEGLPRIHVPDRVGVLIDYAKEEILFFHEGHPVGRVISSHVRGRFHPCLIAVQQFDVEMDPTPTIPALTPEWDPARCQQDIVLSPDKLSAKVEVDTQSARTVWATTTYSSGVLFIEIEVELHGRAGYIVYGVGNRNFAGDSVKQPRAALPFEEYYVVGFSSRGDLITAGAIERRGEEPWNNGDRMAIRIDFESETFAAYKNSHPVLVGDCPGVAVGVSPIVTLLYGPHTIRIDPMPRVPPSPPRWDPNMCPPGVKLSNYECNALNLATTGFPTVLSTSLLRHGSLYIDFFIEYLPEASFMMFGVAGGPAHLSTERVPGPEFHHWGYSSTGEIWAYGARVIGGREDFLTGDTFGMLIDLEADPGTITFYRNGYPVGYYVGLEGPGIVNGIRPCVTFGYTNYCCRINPCARLPAGTPRWDMICKSPDIKVSHDHLSCTNTSWNRSHTARGTSGFSSGTFYFEVRVNYIKLGGYIALCLGTHDIYNNQAVYPPAYYNCFAYTSQGELLRGGEIVAKGLPRVVTGDDMGLRADFANGLIIFYRNRHPVGEMEGLRGELFPAMIFANEHYSATIHTNARERLAVPSFDAEALPRGVHLSQYDMHARNSGGRGFPTIRAAARYRDGSFFFEITVEKLSHSGFLLMGIGSSTIIHNNQYLPSEKYNSYGLSSSGELMAIGEVVSGGHQYYGEGDKVGLICNLDKRVVTFYVNSHQVGEIRNLTPFMEYAPFVVFGNGTFEVTINRVPEIGKIFNVKEKTALESNASRQEHFVHPDYIKDD